MDEKEERARAIRKRNIEILLRLTKPDFDVLDDPYAKIKVKGGGRKSGSVNEPKSRGADPVTRAAANPAARSKSPRTPPPSN